ncbi:MAG: DNA adenine methylase [Kiritimatiellae bacterium]|nr:DNA adenine methylase [Kiritimatiellia bacterium]
MTSLFKEFEYFEYKFPLPQYLGSKYRFRSWIGNFVPAGVKTVVDAFGGSQSMSYYFKQLGFRVLTNDLMSYSDMIGKALIENKGETISDNDVSILLSPNPDVRQFDLMQRLFAGVFFKEEDAAFIDSVRGNVERLENGIKKTGWLIDWRK